MKRLESIEFNNIGVFKNEKITFPKVTAPNKAEVHIFTGPNGSGKTTILEGLVSYFSHTNNTIGKERGSQEDASLKISFNSKDVLFTKNRPFKLMGQDTHSNIIRANSDNSFQLSSSFDYCAFLYSGNRNIISINNTTINNHDTYNPLYQTLEFTKHSHSNKNQTLEWIANAITKKALATMRGNIEKARAYNLIIAKIETIISDIIGQKITFELLDNPIKVVLKQNGNEISFEALSDGLKSLISWIADLLLRLEQTPWIDDIPVLERNFILFLDEIEVHLHPALQRKVLPIVQDLFPNAQIFISTHSPFVVGSVSNAWVYKLELNDGESTISKPIESKAGVSFLSILEDIFDVDEEFDVQTEDLLDEFYALRNKIATGEKVDNTTFKKLITILSSKSVEVKDIIEREVRQLQRKGRL